MNRIILVGNGFDLAHNLRTSYKHFIEWYWRKWGENLLNNPNKYVKDRFTSANITLSESIDSWKSYFEKKKCRTIEDFCECVKRDSSVFRYESNFFESINRSFEFKGWVDIETEYYNNLLKYAYNPQRTNEDFEWLRSLLLDYLKSIDNATITIDGMKEIIESPFLPTEIAIAEREKWKSFVVERMNMNTAQWEYLLNNYGKDTTDYTFIDLFEYAEKHNKDFISIINGEETTENIPNALLLPDKILLLNFNYTTIADRYLSESDIFSTIHIHGELSVPNNVIFGYGDEMDEGYENLKKKNNNECLRHMKTSHYLETDNHRKMLSFIGSAPYQVYIMGHSCGNSDRTLLNTLFEHPNCVSIKPFYYVDKEDKDNYLDIVQNISRNFTDAKKMRDRVVNKMYCQPLPQSSSELTNDK